MNILDTLITSGGDLLPQSGFMGFLLRNWLIIALSVMALGFVFDQALYIIRYRPQDKWKALYLRLFGKADAQPVRQAVVLGRDGVAKASSVRPPSPPTVVEKDGDKVTVYEPVRRRTPASGGDIPAWIDPPARHDPAVRERALDEDVPLVVRGTRPRREPVIVPRGAEPADEDAPVVVRDATRRHGQQEPVTHRPPED